MPAPVDFLSSLICALPIYVPDTDENAAAFGRSGGVTTPAPFPQVRLAGLGECGTHAIVAARLGPWRRNERLLAEELISDFQPGMLVIADRGFYGYRLWQAAADSGAERQAVD